MKKLKYILLLFTLINYGQGVKTFFESPEGKFFISADLHIHTVFSDGSVWPTIRVDEALRDSIDMISLTEHLEYQSHLRDIPHPDRNRSYQIAGGYVKNQPLAVVHGTEITKPMPPGHFNAIFISDANKFFDKEKKALEFNKAIKEANKQGAFVFWNHPAWYAQSPDGNPILRDFQKKRIAQNELHGIEVINFGAYAEESLALALEYDLAILATSDVHGLIEWDYANKGLKRPLTLVFAEERSLNGMKEALFARRTVAAYNELLIGKEAFLIPLIQAMVEIRDVSYINNTSILRLELSNNSSSDLILENQMDYTFYESSPVVHLKAGQSKIIQVKTLETLKNLRLKFKVLSAYTAPKVHPKVVWDIAVDTP